MTGFPDQPVRRENVAETPRTGPVYTNPGYPRPSYGAPKNKLGIAALALAVVALLSVATVFAPVALGAVAVIVGILGHQRVKRGIADNGGVAIAGIVLGGLAIVVGLAFIAIWTTVWKDVRGGDYIDCTEKAGG